MTPTWKPFSSLPIGATFKIPNDPPIRRKINADTACWHMDWVSGPEPRIGSAFYHITPHYMVLVMDLVEVGSRTGPEDRRVSNSGEKAQAQALQEAEQTIRERGVTCSTSHKNPIPLSESYQREMETWKGILTNVQAELRNHYGSFMRLSLGATPDLVAQLVRKFEERGKKMQERANAHADLARENAQLQTKIRTMTRNGTMIAARADRAEAEVSRLQLELGKKIMLAAANKEEADLLRRRLDLGEDSDRRGTVDRRVKNIAGAGWEPGRRSSPGRRHGDQERTRARLATQGDPNAS